MEGTNASGRKVSLLNESGEAPAPFRHNSHPSLHSRTSSYVSTPGFPPTPSLVRSDSSDSQGLQTPSPITPAAHFESRRSSDGVYLSSHPELSPKANMDSYMEPSKEQLAYPILAQHASHGYSMSMQQQQQQQQQQLPPQLPAQLPPQQMHFSSPQLPQQLPPQPPQPHMFRPSMSPTSPPQEPRVQSAPSSSSRSAPKKNQYPCPMAKQYGCTDFFTTSGHAARHAKKHTGKKDAYCPECNKAFTRKDNMEQHRRTHQHGRGAAGSDSRAKKAKTQMRRTKSNSVADATPMAPQAPMAPATATRPQLTRGENYLSSLNYQPPMSVSGDYSPLTPSISHGLDTLAIAASGQQRDIEA
jgi:hypothetical protein